MGREIQEERSVPWEKANPELKKSIYTDLVTFIHLLARAKFCLGFLTNGNSQIYVVWDCFCCQFLKDCCYFVSKSRKAACLGHFFGAQFYSCADVGKLRVSISLGCSTVTSSSTDLGVPVKVTCRWGCLSGKGMILDYACGPHPVGGRPRDKNGGFLGAGILLYQFLPEFLGCPMDFRLTNPVLPINLSLSLSLVPFFPITNQSRFCSITRCELFSFCVGLLGLRRLDSACTVYTGGREGAFEKEGLPCLLLKSSARSELGTRSPSSLPPSQPPSIFSHPLLTSFPL